MRESHFELETGISYLLRIGVLLCSAVIALGWYRSSFIEKSGANVLKQLALGKELEGTQLVTSISEVWAQIRHLNASTVISIGIFLLILLPILRVALTVILFLLQRDYLYFFFSFSVLALLVFSFYWGHVI